jgi:hypothetical protein
MNTQGWTTQPPTADGFYWLDLCRPRRSPCVVEIHNRNANFAGVEDLVEPKDFQPNWRWYGPIPLPPTEPQPPAQVTDAMVHAADKAMFGKMVQGEARLETVRLGLEAAMTTAGQRCKTCKTCKHWSPLSESYRDPEVAAGGICRSSKLDEDQGQGHGADMLVYRYSEGGQFWTGPEFGCVHHEDRA